MTALLTIGICQASAQTPIIPADRASDEFRRRTAIPNKVTIPPHSSEPAATLDQLINQSESIIEATVLSSRLQEPGDRYDPLLITQHLIVINKAFRGGSVAASQHIILNQVGGKTADREVNVEGVPMMQTGQRFILFLRPQKGLGADAKDDYKIYSVVGGGAGMFQIENGKIRNLPLHQDPLKQFDGVSNDDFENALLDRIHHRIIPPTRHLLPHPQGAAAKAPGH
jgi:hypothetical protein